jgi:RNA ligase (TIGR02306 family)
LEGTSERAPKDAPPVYDVENFKHYNTTFKQGDEVVVTEKIHGSNGRYMFDGKRMWVGSKNLWKSEKSKCIWRRVLKDYPQIEEWCRAHPKNTLYTEVVPTQKGYDYGTNEKKPTDIFVFDIRDQDGVYWPKAKSLVEIKPVPIVYAGPFDKETINKLAEGKTLVTNAKHIREGIVIASCEERYERGLGRVQLKLKSNAFLEAEGKR